MRLGPITTLYRIARRLPARLGASEDTWYFPAYVGARQAVRRTVNAVSWAQLGWVGAIRSARWVGESTYEVAGWAYERGYGFEETPTVDVVFHAHGCEPLPATVFNYDEIMANSRIRGARHDYTNTGFVAEIDATELIRRSGGRARTWHAEITVRGDERTVHGHFARRIFPGSGLLPLPKTFDGVQVVPGWSTVSGLQLRVGTPAALATEAQVVDRRLDVTVQLNGIEVAEARLESPQGVTNLVVESLAEPGQVRLTGLVPLVDPYGHSSLLDPGEDEDLFSPELEGVALPVLSYRVLVTDTKSREHAVRTAADPVDRTVWPASPPLVYGAHDGTLRLRDTEAMLVVTDARIATEPEFGLQVSGRVLGDLTGARIDLVGPRAERPMRITWHDDGTFEGFAPWLASTWGGPELPPPSGQYTLRGHTAAGSWFRIGSGIALIDRAPERVETPWFTSVLGVGSGRRLVCSLTLPWRPSEYGSYRQHRLRVHFQRPDLPVSDQFYFESFMGQGVTCNPFALDRELARRLPDAKRYWGVADRSVPVPEGAVAVVRGTRAWWAARQTSRFVITNEWMTNTYEHNPGQFLLQTWHGTMFKTIGLDRKGTDLLTRQALLNERSKWDVLLSQNRHSTDIFRTAYAWEKDIWEEGYPRNDALITEPREPVRRRLGIGDDQVALLYAPTWRENQEGLVTFLDLAQLMVDLGDRYVLLLRGHTRTMGFGADVQLPGVIDVTSYPNITDLYLAADAMITDYSSVMFDYSVTGRPMIFYVPDIEEYSGSLRGTYFDLGSEAPGPVLTRQDEVLSAVASLESSAPAHAARYAAWQRKFNSHDDGGSAARVIDRLLDLG